MEDKMRNTVCDSSLQFIRNGVPQFIRTIFEEFSKTQIGVSNLFEKKSAVDLVSASFVSVKAKSLPYIDFIKNVDSKTALDLQDHLSTINIEFDNYTKIYQDELNNLGEGDIYAPLTRIESVITAFDTGFEEYTINCVPLLYMIPGYCDSAYIPSSDSLRATLYHTDQMGSTAFFDNFSSTLKIDVNHVMSIMFNYLIGKESTNELCCTSDTNDADLKESIVYMNKLINLGKSLANGSESVNVTEMIDTISKQVTASAVITYLAYYSKMIGANSNLVDWISKTFMKDFINKLDTDMIRMSGVDDDNGTDINDNNASSKKTMTDSDKNNYNVIQLGFTNWSFVIDTIFHSSPNTDNAKHVSDFSKAAYNALVEMIRAKYTTYNTLFYINANGIANIKDLVEIGYKRVLDSDNIMYLKQIKTLPQKGILRDNSDKYAHYSGDNTQLVNSVYTVKKIATIFMNLAYLTLMDFTLKHLEGAVDEPDFVTGKSKRELFVTMYNKISRSLVNSINDHTSLSGSGYNSYVIDTYYLDSIKRSNKKIGSTIDSITDWEVKSNDNEYYKRCNDDNFNTTRKNIYENRKNDIDRVACSLYDIRPASQIRSLSYNLKSSNINNDCYSYNDSVSDSEQSFSNFSAPKFLESITKVTLKPDTPMMASLESLESLEALEEKADELEAVSGESEWAYGNYNALSGLTSSVMEIKNDSDMNHTGPTVDEMMQSQNVDNTTEQESNESYKARIDLLEHKITSIMLRHFDK
jgi:hypothetical protein